jgi:UDP-glucose 4-epimerase
MNRRQRSALSSMRILVTGSNGFIGSNLVAALAQLGADVTGLSRGGDAKSVPAKGVRFVNCDLRDADRTRALVRSIRPQLVFHLAAYPDGPESGLQTQGVLENNVGGLVNLLEGLRELSAVTLVYGDSAKAYGNTGVPYRCEQALEPLSAYAVSKVAGWGFVDLYRRVHGIQAFGLRPTLVYGPGQRFNLFSYLMNSINPNNFDIALDGGAQTRDPIYIDDAVDAFIAAAEHGTALNGRNVPLGGGREVSVTELAELTVQVLGGKQRVVSRPTNVRLTETMRSWCDNAEIFRAIGWKPAIGLEEGILRTAQSLGMTVAPIAPAAVFAERV